MSAYFTFTVVTLLPLYWFYKFVNGTILALLRRYTRLSKMGGTARTATVTKRLLRKGGGTANEVINITFEFLNFVGSPITQSLQFVDSKPHLKRYEVGKTFDIYIHETTKGPNKVTLATKNLKFNPVFLAINWLLAIGFFALLVWYYSTIWAKWQGDEKIFHELFSHDTVFLLSLIYAGVALFMYGLFRGLGLAFKSQEKEIRLKYYGISTLAQVTNYEQTNVRINDNPVVRFYFSFKDENGQRHEGNDKQLIPLIEVGRVPGMTNLEVSYLPDFPQQARLKANLKELSSFNFVAMVFYFVLFIFSAIVLGIFTASILN